MGWKGWGGKSSCKVLRQLVQLTVNMCNYKNRQAPCYRCDGIPQRQHILECLIFLFITRLYLVSLRPTSY